MSEKIEIQKGIPVPTSSMCEKKYPWRLLNVGDSFLMSVGLSNGHSAAYDACRRFSPKKFIAKTVTEDGVKRIRIWRTE